MDLRNEDYIAFYWDYNKGVISKQNAAKETNIEVSNISHIGENYYIVHFLYGYKSIAETVKFEDIVAIGNLKTGKTKLKGWSGTFDLV